jgi:biotin-(acetyl-CoA carboxylase) ligase
MHNRLSGTFEGIDKEGNIVIKLASGEKFPMNTGEVFFDSKPDHTAKIEL